MRYLGIDYGAKRIGIAISDDAASFAFPKETIPNDVTAIDRLAKMVRDEKIDSIVMGDTRAMNGVDNEITEEAMRFKDALEAHVGRSVSIAREAFSSMEAARFAPKGAHDDAAAAAIILQRHLDARRD